MTIMTCGVSDMDFVSLHHHTTFSYGDGFGKPSEHFERAAELGMSALAMTEHGNVSSHAQAEKASKATGVKPIYGLEAYTAPDNMREQQVYNDDGTSPLTKDGKPRVGNTRKWHQTVLAMDEEGYRNLNLMVTRSWSEGFYRWPTVTDSILKDTHEGLILTSGCADSRLACTILGGKNIPTPSRPNIKAGLALARRYKRLLGDRYYLEVQRFPELDRTRTLNKIYAEISEELNIPLVATADCHYPRPEDNEMQKILHAASRSTGTVAAAEASWEYDILLTFPESDDQIVRQLIETGLTRAQAVSAVENTAVIADRCDVELPRSETIRFPLPRGYKSISQLIWDKLREGWRYRWPRNQHMRRNKRAYVDRLRYEMELIEYKDFSDYFMMISTAVVWAKENGIPVGPARGSAAGSLVCYMLRITEVDPMQFPTMMFERFIDKDRSDLPDVDLDFADDRRDEVRQHLVDIYGADHVGNIGNFGRYRGKNSINAVARVYGIPQSEAKLINDLIVERSGGDSRFDASLEDTFDMFPVAKAVLDRHPEFKYAMRLEGNYERMGVHAAGLVVSNNPITDTCALYERDNVGVDKKTVNVVAYDKKDAEYLGMLKADFLGLSTMGMISLALDFIGMSLDELYRIPLTDPKTLQAFNEADVIGIFQFEGRATRIMTMDVKPESFMEIADINALSRPGPLFSGASAQYVDIKHGRKKPDHLHPIVDKYTAQSHYQIIYQEQVLAILREMGGFPASFTGALRKVISLKLGEAQFNEFRPKFINGAKEHHDIDEELADRVWRLMVTSATYSFNIAHCISYGMLAFWCMWLKVHHPVEFYTAQLIKTNDEDKQAKLIKDAERHGIDVLPPTIKHSRATWSPLPAKRSVQGGFRQIPGVGEKTAHAIIEWIDEQPNQEDLDWEDLTAVKGIGAVRMGKMRDFARDDDPWGLNRSRDVLNALRTEMQSNPKGWPLIPTYTSSSIPREHQGKMHIVWMGFPRERNYQDYIENQRSRTGEEVEDILRRMTRKDLVTSCVLRCYDDEDEEVYLRFSRFTYPRFKNTLESLSLTGDDIVIAAGTKHHAFGISVLVEKMLVVRVQ